MRCFLSLIFAVLALMHSSYVFAEGELPAMLISIPDSVDTLFIAETSTSTFHRFDRVGDEVVSSGSYFMSIGQKGAGKERSGDQRTPLGAYFVTEQLDTSKLHEKYGVTAFPLDYPNEWDRRADRDGDGIWVHGVLSGAEQRPPLDTDGCIALSNETLLTLAPSFVDNITPVLVTRKVNWVKPADTAALRAELEVNVAEWVTSQTQGDLYAYLSLYDENFSRWGMDKAEWSSLVLEAAISKTKYKALTSELLLLAYPEEDGVFLSRFRLTIVEQEIETVTTGRLYWRRDDRGALKIIAEDQG